MKKTYSLIFLCLFIPGLTFAHGSHGSGFMAGFTHPIFGLDHNLAILGSSILGHFFYPKKWYLFPLSFIAMMIVGGFTGIGQEANLLIEKVIAGSVLLIGITVAFRPNVNSIVLIVLMAAFGFFHGFAHGVEMPETTTALKYISGFSVGAVLLAIVGWLISRLIKTQKQSNAHYKILGGFLIGCSFIIFMG